MGGQEVDVVLESPSGHLVGIEVKTSATVGAGDFKGLHSLAEETGETVDLAGIGVIGQPGPDELCDILFEFVRWFAAGPQHDERLDYLPPELVRLADDRRLRHRRMFDKGRFHLERAQPLSGGLDHVVRPSQEPDIAVLVPVGLIAADVPAGDAEVFPVTFLVPPDTHHHGRPPGPEG